MQPESPSLGDMEGVLPFPASPEEAVKGARYRGPDGRVWRWTGEYFELAE